MAAYRTDNRPRNANGSVSNAIQPFGIMGGGGAQPSFMGLSAPQSMVQQAPGITGQSIGLRGPLDAMAASMGRYTDTATQEMKAKQDNSENLLRGLLGQMNGDPMYGYARQYAMDAARNPGIDPSLLAQMRGRVAAQAAAATAAGARNIMGSMARGNIRGAGATNALLLNQNRGEIGRTNATMDIDKWAAEQAKQGKAQGLAGLLSTLGQQYNQKAGLAGQLVNVQQGYNPLQWLQQINGIMSPMGAAGQGVGLQSRPGTLPGVNVPAPGTLPTVPAAGTGKKATSTAPIATPPGVTAITDAVKGVAQSPQTSDFLKWLAAQLAKGPATASLGPIGAIGSGVAAGLAGWPNASGPGPGLAWDRFPGWDINLGNRKLSE